MKFILVSTENKVLFKFDIENKVHTLWSLPMLRWHVMLSPPWTHQLWQWKYRKHVIMLLQIFRTTEINVLLKRCYMKMCSNNNTTTLWWRINSGTKNNNGKCLNWKKPSSSSRINNRRNVETSFVTDGNENFGTR